MLNVMWQIMLHHAHAFQDSLEIQRFRVMNHRNVCWCHLCNAAHVSIIPPPLFIPFSELDPPINVCSPSPCGPYSVCREINGHAVCSCQDQYIGSPPNCRPECIVNSECALDKACVNQRCVDPCPGTCGHHATCRVLNHSPVCSCPPQYTGDPFFGCVVETSNEIYWISLGDMKV